MLHRLTALLDSLPPFRDGLNQHHKAEPHIHELRTAVLDRTWLGLIGLAAIGVPISLSRASYTGWLDIYSLHIAIGALVVITYAMRHRLSLTERTSILLAFFWIIGVAGIIALGPLGAGLWWLVTSVLLAGMVFSSRTGWWLMAAIALILLATGTGFISGALTLSVDANHYVRQPQSWATLFIATAFLPLVVFQSIVSLTQKLRLLYQNLELAHTELEQEKAIVEKFAEVQRLGRERALAELNTAQEQLLEKEKLAALGKSVAAIAHELNTPLGINVTAASTLIGRIAETQAALSQNTLTHTALEDHLEVIDQAAQLLNSNSIRASELVQMYKVVSIDKASDASRQIDLKNYIGLVLGSLKPELKGHKFKIDTQIQDNISLSCKPGALAQIVTNLVLNAANHAFADNADGVLSITGQLDNGSIVLSFSDDGAGMTPQTQSRIFEEFFTTRRSSGGSGIGMHLVKQLTTEVLRGDIAVDSRPDRGTRITLRLPCDQPSTPSHD